MSDKSQTKLLWIDIETTGLDSKEDRILEVYVCTASLDAPFKIDPVTFHRVVHLPPERVGELDPFIHRMHSKSGLLEECQKSNYKSGQLENELLDFYVRGEQRTQLAGSSVRFDADFIREQMPRLGENLSYRLFDVRPIILLCESLGMKELKKGEDHRAKADLDETIAHGRTCAEWILTSDKVNSLLGAFK